MQQRSAANHSSRSHPLNRLKRIFLSFISFLLFVLLFIFGDLVLKQGLIWSTGLVIASGIMFFAATIFLYLSLKNIFLVRKFARYLPTASVLLFWVMMISLPIRNSNRDPLTGSQTLYQLSKPAGHCLYFLKKSSQSFFKSPLYFALSDKNQTRYQQAENFCQISHIIRLFDLINIFDLDQDNFRHLAICRHYRIANPFLCFKRIENKILSQDYMTGSGQQTIDLISFLLKNRERFLKLKHGVDNIGP